MKLSGAVLLTLLAGVGASKSDPQTEQDVWDNILDGNLEGTTFIDSSHLPAKPPSASFHSDQNDFSYWTDMAQIGIRTYVPFFEANNDGIKDSRGTISSASHPGTDTTSYISLESVKQKISELPGLQQSGQAIRGNELGLLRLNTAFYPECDGEEYCGIALGVTAADHAKVRPVLDEIFGDGTTDGRIGYTGNKWSRTALRQSALSFVRTRNSLAPKNDAGMWTTQVLHETALGMVLTDDEAQAFVDFQQKAVVITALPSFVPEWLGDRLGLPEALSKKAFYLSRYETAIRNQIAKGVITTLSADDAEGIKKASWGVLDALIFAGGLSVPGIIHSGLAAYYTGLTGTDFDINDVNHAPLLVMETIRNYPAVLGVPYIVDSHRHAPLAGMGGYDKGVYGEDALNFRIRYSDSEGADGNEDGLLFYHRHSIDWADSALPAKDADGNEIPHTNHICPAKSMSYNMILSFWEAMDPTNWYVDPDTKIERENGPVWWGNFDIHRRCESMGTHVGLKQASRAYSSHKQGASCNWFSWCDDGFECNRSGWSWSGSCKFNKNIKFHGETCSDNSQCDNKFTDEAGVDLACRFNKCAFADGNECEEDTTIEFAEYTELPFGDAGETAGAWSVVVGGGVAISGAGVFMLRKPKSHLKHAKMDEADSAL